MPVKPAHYVTSLEYLRVLRMAARLDHLGRKIKSLMVLNPANCLTSVVVLRYSVNEIVKFWRTTTDR
ncbi:hypothetical protein J6590_107522, partial [Homalodisca vitripennis]